jgi:hypothetical protein
MFKVEFFVEDKKLPDSLRALTGLIRGLPSVVPVVNVDESHHSGLKPKTNGALLDAFALHIARFDHPFGPSDVREFLKSIGKAPGSASYLVQKARAARLIKVIGKSSSVKYHTIKRLPAPAKKETAHG